MKDEHIVPWKHICLHTLFGVLVGVLIGMLPGTPENTSVDASPLLAEEKSAWADITFTPEEKAWLAQKHTVRARTALWPPFQFWDTGPKGISVDYLKIIAEHCGFHVEFYKADSPWNEALENIKQHRHTDLFLTIKRTPEREHFIAFTDEYLSLPWVIFTRVDGDFVGGMQDLYGKTVAVQRGFVMHKN